MNLDKAFHALSDPARRDLILTLSRGPRTAGSLAEPQTISRPAVSRHLRVLHEAGLVEVKIRGRHRWYSLKPEPISDLQLWLDEVSAMWQEGLQALKAFVEEDETRNIDGKGKA